MEAINKAIADLALYPDGGGFALKEEVVMRRFGVAMNQIILGNGSERHSGIGRAHVSRWDFSGVFAARVRGVPVATTAVGATGIEVPAKDFGNDLDALLTAIRADTRVVFLANPNNPQARSSRAAIKAVLQKGS